jgi:hypothetical protein
MKIDNSAQLRAILLQTMTLLIEGKLSVPQANAIANLSAEQHKSLKDSFIRDVEIVNNPKLASLGYSDTAITLEAVA